MVATTMSCIDSEVRKLDNCLRLVDNLAVKYESNGDRALSSNKDKVQNIAQH